MNTLDLDVTIDFINLNITMGADLDLEVIIGNKDLELISEALTVEVNSNFIPLQQVEVIDNLTSDDPDKPLSARQGKELKSLVDSKIESIVAGDNISIDNTDPQNPIINSESQVSNFTEYDRPDTGDYYYFGDISVTPNKVNRWKKELGTPQGSATGDWGDRLTLNYT